MRVQEGFFQMRLFEVVTKDMWQHSCHTHLDVTQALQYLRQGLDEYVRIPFTVPKRTALENKRKVILEYARRMGLSVQTRYRDGWILIRNVTAIRKQMNTKSKRLVINL
jgi:hypothetical protein